MTSRRTPITFLAFTERLGVKLTPGQRVLTAVSYDGVDPANLASAADRELARLIFGDKVLKVPLMARNVALNLCGARGGKSYVLTALRLLHLALTVDLSILAPGEHASALIVAPNLKLARQTYRFVLGAAQHKLLASRIVGKPSKESFVLARERGHRVTVECLPASRGGAAIRARYYVGAGLDEFAFFRNEDFQVNDTEIFRATTPRILPGGQVVISSTAWARIGLMYKLFKDNWNQPGTCVAALAPTVLLNPSKRFDIEIERERDPDNAAREFDCQFMDAGSITFFSHEAVDKAVDKGLFLPLTPPPGCEILIGADLGFRRDSSALVVVYKMPNGTYVVADILEMRPEPGVPLKPSEVVEQFAATAKRHECSWILADQHYRETLDEELAKHNLSYIPAPGGAEGKVTAHLHARNILHSDKLRIPDHPRLVDQMKQLVSKPTPGGGLSLVSPRSSTGGHGDILSALVLAISQRAGQKASETLPMRPITVEEAIQRQTKLAWDKYEQRRIEALIDQQEAEGFGGGGVGSGGFDAFGGGWGG